eukprot:365325-Chlamydomonas_euryale.AAC.38
MQVRQRVGCPAVQATLAAAPAGLMALAAHAAAAAFAAPPAAAEAAAVAAEVAAQTSLQRQHVTDGCVGHLVRVVVPTALGCSSLLQRIPARAVLGVRWLHPDARLPALSMPALLPAASVALLAAAPVALPPVPLLAPAAVPHVPLRVTACSSTLCACWVSPCCCLPSSPGLAVLPRDTPRLSTDSCELPPSSSAPCQSHRTLTSAGGASAEVAAALRRPVRCPRVVENIDCCCSSVCCRRPSRASAAGLATCWCTGMCRCPCCTPWGSGCGRCCGPSGCGVCSVPDPGCAPCHAGSASDMPTPAWRRAFLSCSRRSERPSSVPNSAAVAALPLAARLAAGAAGTARSAPPSASLSASMSPAGGF